MKRVLVATACDAAHFALAEDLLASLCVAQERDFALGFILLGDGSPAAIMGMVDEFAAATPDPDGFDRESGFVVAQLAIKSRLPEFFPGYETYVWLDGDTWVQSAAGIDQIVASAGAADLCIHPQLDPNYFGCSYPDDYTLTTYERVFGAAMRERFSRFPMVNTGVVAARASSPLWKLWSDLQIDIRESARGRADRFFSDQIPLHYLIFSGALTLYPLRAVNNWLVRHCVPRLSQERGCLTAPTYPFEHINIVHLLGRAKMDTYQLDGYNGSLRYRDIRAHLGHPLVGQTGTP